MAHTLEAFCADCRILLGGGGPLSEVLPRMSEGLARLLDNPDFVAANFKPDDDFTKKQLHHCPITDFYVLAHVHQGPKEGAPHSHGASWAIYGTALGVTGMKEWQRVNPETEEAAVLRLAERYDLTKGQARAYGPHTIHSTIHPAKAWVIRVTGTNLDVLARYRFKRGRDSILEAA
jgi:hypothetical protein